MSGSGPNLEAGDLEFGEVQEQRPVPPPLSPDRDGHLATAPVVRPGSANHSATDVYVSLEAFLDMQQHAAEDTSIELGGLLLGRRGDHPDGTPWVMIVDSLRARHYRATRGSFRFTHDTWADLNAQRAELPPATEIVGWYHTHPGWGVFLSDQDIFICNHFFAHPDDVALVIDPTSGDTGLFVRRGSPRDEPPERLSGYRLFTHRRRAAELAAWATYFSGVGTMSDASLPEQPSGSSQSPGSRQSYGSRWPLAFPASHAPPVIVTTGGDGSGVSKGWAALGAGLLGSQLAILLAILLALSSRPEPAPRPAEAAPSAAETLRIREAVVDEMLRKIVSDGADGATESWHAAELANAELRAANLGLLSRVESLTAELQSERQGRQQSQRELSRSAERLAETERQLAERDLAERQLAERQLAERGAASGAPGGGSPGAATDGWFDWRAVLAGAAGGIVVGWFVTSLAARREPHGTEENARERGEPGDS